MDEKETAIQQMAMVIAALTMELDTLNETHKRSLQIIEEKRAELELLRAEVVRMNQENYPSNRDTEMEWTERILK